MTLNDLKKVAQNIINLEREIEIEERQIALDRAKGLSIEKDRDLVLIKIKKVLSHFEESNIAWVTVDSNLVIQ